MILTGDAEFNFEIETKLKFSFRFKVKRNMYLWQKKYSKKGSALKYTKLRKTNTSSFKSEYGNKKM